MSSHSMTLWATRNLRQPLCNGWPNESLPHAQGFTTFRDTSHLSLFGNTACETCHALHPKAEYAKYYAGENATVAAREPSHFQSNFAPLAKTLCMQCHQPKVAGDSCLLCHRYQAGSTNTEIGGRNALRPLLGQSNSLRGAASPGEKGQPQIVPSLPLVDAPKSKASQELGKNAINTIILKRHLFSRLGRFARLILIAIFLCLTLSACQQKVVLVPGENDLVVLNGCVISACNYLAVVKTQHSLDRNFWAKILLVRYKDHPAGHAYCVWETDGTIYGYDRNAGSFPIPIYTREPTVIATVLADGLSKVLKEQLFVAQAEFVEPSKSDLYKF